MSLPVSRTTVGSGDAACAVICGDSREELKAYEGQADLIVTSPPYADARHRHYDGVHPDEFVEWFMSFHEPFFKALKPTGSFVLNLKDKIVDGVRHRYVWRTVEALCERGWLSIDDYLWHKTNPMPGFWPTRLRDGWEYCFHLAKRKRPYMNQDAVRRPIGDWVESAPANPAAKNRTDTNPRNRAGFGPNPRPGVESQPVPPPKFSAPPPAGESASHLANRNAPSLTRDACGGPTANGVKPASQSSATKTRADTTPRTRAASGATSRAGLTSRRFSPRTSSASRSSARTRGTLLSSPLTSRSSSSSCSAPKAA